MPKEDQTAPTAQPVRTELAAVDRILPELKRGGAMRYRRTSWGYIRWAPEDERPTAYLCPPRWRLASTMRWADVFGVEGNWLVMGPLIAMTFAIIAAALTAGVNLDRQPLLTIILVLMSLAGFAGYKLDEAVQARIEPACVDDDSPLVLLQTAHDQGAIAEDTLAEHVSDRAHFRDLCRSGPAADAVREAVKRTADLRVRASGSGLPEVTALLDRLWRATAPTSVGWRALSAVLDDVAQVVGQFDGAVEQQQVTASRGVLEDVAYRNLSLLSVDTVGELRVKLETYRDYL